MTAQSTYPAEFQPIARAIDLYVDQTFRSDAGSMFTPGAPIWTTSSLSELKRLFIDQPDETSASFDEKLARQLATASDPALQLMAELLYIYFMVARQIRGKTKLDAVGRILSRMRRPVPIPESLVQAADQGMTSTGTFYLTSKPHQLWFLIKMSLAWRELSAPERQALLADPWAFKAFLLSVQESSQAPMRMAVQHFVFPDTFEMIISARHKQLIARGFPEIAPDETDEDRKLLAIKRAHPPATNDLYFFYRTDITKRWEPEREQSEFTASQSVEPLAAVRPKPGDADDAVTLLARQLYLDPKWVSEVRDVLLERGQIVLHGPPGTGKTRLARDLAHALASKDRVQFVQFHPAYSYEEFIEGLRPKVGSGAGVFEVRHGPLRRIAAAAAASPGETHIMLLDEINRANLPRVLGELLFLLEYRTDSVLLPYSGEQFSLPRNLLFIGTMNTADRSIALIDSAIRRRFAFFRLAPDCPPIEGLLADWLDGHAPEMGWVHALVHRANELIRSSDHAIGPTFFMRAGLNDAMVERIWKRQVMPYLDEFLHDAPELARAIDFHTLRSDIDRDRGSNA